MTDKRKKGSRVKIDQPKGDASELSTDELKKVKGGHSGGVNVLMGDGSVRFTKTSPSITDGTSNTIMVGEQKG